MDQQKSSLHPRYRQKLTSGDIGAYESENRIFETSTEFLHGKYFRILNYLEDVNIKLKIYKKPQTYSLLLQCSEQAWLLLGARGVIEFIVAY